MNDVKLQSAIDVLVELHDDNVALESIRFHGNLQHANVALSAVAGIVRHLMQVRDAAYVHPHARNTDE